MNTLVGKNGVSGSAIRISPKLRITSCMQDVQPWNLSGADIMNAVGVDALGLAWKSLKQ